MKTLKFVIIYIVLFFSVFMATSQVVITGKSGSYAGTKLKLCEFADRITYSINPIQEVAVDDNGYFTFSFKVDSIRKVFIDLPTIRAFIYVEPDKKYEVRIPKKISMTDEQFFNPYFVKQQLPIYIYKPPKNDINLFLQSYNSFLKYHKQIISKYKREIYQKKYLDSIELISDTMFADKNIVFLNRYKRLEFAKMRHNFIQYKKSFFLDSFFRTMPVLFHSASYMLLFNEVFDTPFLIGNSLLSQDIVSRGIAKHDFSFILSSFKSKYPGLAPDFVELVVLKGLFEKFYEETNKQKDIIILFRNIDNTRLNSNNRLIATNILNEITKLRIGEKLPDIILPDKRNRDIDLSKFNDQFIYLQFFSPKNYVCSQQILFLKKYHDQKVKKLKIITIFVGGNKQEMADYLNKNKQYKWLFVFAEKNSKVLEDFDIRVYPSYFLIAPDGTLAVEKTPSPEGNFEKVYTDLYKKWYKH